MRLQRAEQERGAGEHGLRLVEAEEENDSEKEEDADLAGKQAGEHRGKNITDEVGAASRAAIQNPH